MPLDRRAGPRGAAFNADTCFVTDCAVQLCAARRGWDQKCGRRAETRLVRRGFGAASGSFLRSSASVFKWESRICRRTQVDMSYGLALDAVAAPSALNAILVHVPMFLWARNASSMGRILTPEGLIHATAFGVLLWSSMGVRGWLLGVTFLVLGSAVTKLGFSTKKKEKTEQSRGGRRGPENVWGAAGGGALCALGILITQVLQALPTPSAVAISTQTLDLLARAFEVGFVCSMCSKLSDTVSSEIGKAYGKTTYLITTLRPVPRGTEGAVSLEGTLAGVVASVFMALLGFASGLITASDVGVAVFAALVATSAESVIGATIQDSKGLSNEFVNFIMTVIGASVGVVVIALTVRSSAM